MLRFCSEIRLLSFLFIAQFAVLVAICGNDAMAEEDVIIIDEDALSWISESDAPKSGSNLLRIKFDKSQSTLSDADVKAIDSMLKILGDPNQKIKVKSYANKDDGEQKARETAIQRMLNLRKNLIGMGFDISNANFFVFGGDGNKQNLDYIDIDKY